MLTIPSFHCGPKSRWYARLTSCGLFTPGMFGKADLLSGTSAIRDFRICAGWRGRSVPHPLVHIRDERSPIPLNGIGIVALLRIGIWRAGAASLRRKWRGKMLQASEKINARIFS